MVMHNNAVLTPPRQGAKVCFAVRRHYEPCYTKAASVQDQACHEEVGRPPHEEIKGYRELTSNRSKPQLLFKKTGAKSFEPMKDSSAPMFADIPKKDAKSEEGADA